MVLPGFNVLTIHSLAETQPSLFVSIKEN
jgi:hypothetical protein